MFTREYIAKWLAYLVLITFLLIIVGGATRVFDAGMSCPDWPTCYGAVVPFPESVVSGGYVVDGQHYQWWQVMLEWGHRFLAMVVGFGVLGGLILSAILRKEDSRLWKLGVLTTVLILAQIKLGGLTVWLGNIHWSVALHLGNAMLVLGAIIWWRRMAALPLQHEVYIVSKNTQIAFHSFAAMVLCTMMIGAMVSSSYAGGVCGGLLSCNGEWLPQNDWHQFLHMKHRYVATLTFLLSIVLVLLGKTKEAYIRAVAKRIHFAVLGQVGLGILTLYSFSYYPQYYHALSVAHLAWGTVVWIMALGGILTLYYGKSGRFHGK